MEERLLRKVIRFVTLNGFLLPGWLIKKDIVVQNKSHRSMFRQIFRHQRVLYYHEPLKEGYIAEYDRGRFFRELFYFAKSMLRFAKDYRSLQADYKDSVRNMSSREFWDEVYSFK